MPQVNIKNKGSKAQTDTFVRTCFQFDADGFVQVFTDGSVIKRASFGVWFGANQANLSGAVNTG